jgi:hypothetical protein
MKRNVISLIFGLALCSCVLFAHEDVPLPWHEATIRFGEPKEGNFLHITTNEDDELTTLTMHWNG